MEFAALVGLDWADEKHVWALQPAGGNRIEHGAVDQTPEAIEQWASQLAQRFGGRPIAVALEQARGAVVAMLSKYEHLVLFPVHPNTLANYRKSFCPSGAKNDTSDGDLLLDLLQRHRDRLRPLKPDTEATRKLKFLVEERRHFVDERTRLTNRLTNWLKQYFPQPLGWFDEVGSPLVCDLLERWPTLSELKKAAPEELGGFLREHNCRGKERIEELQQWISQAVPATKDGALEASAALSVRHLVRLIGSLREAIADFDRTLEGITKAHPDFAIVASLPGAGPALEPRLIAAVGTDRERFASAGEMQCHAGIAPVLDQSGPKHVVRFRHACSKFVRQTFQEWAQHSIPKSQWASEYYKRKRAEGKDHHTAVRALSYKWIRIFYRCWKDGVPYDEERYQKALCQRVRPATPGQKTDGRPKTPTSSKPQPLQLKWKSCGSFSKPSEISF